MLDSLPLGLCQGICHSNSEKATIKNKYAYNKKNDSNTSRPSGCIRQRQRERERERERVVRITRTPALLYGSLPAAVH